MKQLFLAELFGTFCLVFAGTGAIVIDEVSHGAVGHVGIAATFGLIILSMIYALGDVSGAHFNPAVTIAFVFARKIKSRLATFYIAGQFIGGILASALLAFLFPQSILLGATLPAGAPLQSLILEAILTLILMFVILSVATGAKERGPIAGIAIGSVVGLEAMFAGPISGASMNPIRSIAPAIFSGHLEHLWIYLVGPIVGALLALLLSRNIFVETAPKMSSSTP